MKMNKVLQWFMALSLTTAACMGLGAVSASAEVLDTNNIYINYETQKLVVTVGEGSGDEDGDDSQDGDESQPSGNAEEAGVTDNQILFGVSAFNSRNKRIKTSAWEIYDVKEGQVVIDLSSLNTQKDNYVQVKGDISSDPVTLYIPATDKTAKLKFDAYAGVPYITRGTDATKSAAWQYRTQYGSWTEFGVLNGSATDVDLSIYQQRGATLYFRIAGESYAEPSTAKTDLNDAAGETLKNAYTMPSLPGKEIKVAVGKKAAAPKATADYAKQTVTIPKGVNWRVNSAEGVTDFTATPTGDKLVLDKTTYADAYAKIFAGGTVEVVKPGDKDRKKAESKIFQLSFKAKDETVVTNEDKNNDVTKAVITEAEGKTVKATLAGPSRGKYSLKIENKTENKYEIVRGGASAPVVGTSGLKIVAIAKGKTVTLRDVKADEAIWIHRAGDKKATMWATDYVSMGKVVIPSGDTPVAPTEPTEEELLQMVADEYFKSSVEVTNPSRDDVISVVADGKQATLNTASDFELSNGKTCTGVTASLSFDGEAGDLVIDESSGELIYDGRTVSAQEITVTLTLSKSGVESITKTITVSVIKSA